MLDRLPQQVFKFKVERSKVVLDLTQEVFYEKFTGKMSDA